MGKFEVEFEITGLKLRMKGERTDIPMMARNVANQVAGLFQPAVDIIEGNTPEPQLSRPVFDATPSASAEQAADRPRKRSVRSKSARNGERLEEPTLNADPAVFGAPLQAWSTIDKSIWLLFVAAEGGGPKEMIGNKIANVFSSQFREAGMIRRQNVNRDLLAVGTGNEALANRRADNSWFLTERGKKRARELITQAQQGAQAET